MPISALPTPPSRIDAPQDFSDRADALLGALPTFVSEANALQSDVNSKQNSAASAASSASSSAIAASNSESAAALSASAAAISAADASGYASSAASSAANALSEADRAAAAAATVDLPPAAGKAFKLLRQNAGNTALEYFDLVGTVSQSGGIPTGAVVECGSNANGEYVRFADGTQICMRDSIISSAYPDQNPFAGTWTYPAAFSLIPVLGGSASVDDAFDGYFLHISFRQNGTTSVRVVAQKATSPNGAVFVSVIAVGRWY